MSNESICQGIEDYYDQLLSGDALEAFQRHLDDCANCRQKLEALQTTDSDLADAWQRVVLPPVQVRHSHKSVTSHSVLKSPLWQTAAAVALLASAIAFAFLVRSGSDEIASSPRQPDQVPQSAKRPLPIKFVGDRPMFASVDFDDETMAIAVGSIPELTVYSVIPKTTYAKPDQEH